MLVQDLAYSIYNYPGATKVDSGKKRQQIHTMTSCFLHFSACFFYVSILYRVRQRRIARGVARFFGKRFWPFGDWVCFGFVFLGRKAVSFS